MCISLIVGFHYIFGISCVPNMGNKKVVKPECDQVLFAQAGIFLCSFVMLHSI